MRLIGAGQVDGLTRNTTRLASINDGLRAGGASPATVTMVHAAAHLLRHSRLGLPPRCVLDIVIGDECGG